MRSEVGRGRGGGYPLLSRGAEEYPVNLILASLEAAKAEDIVSFSLQGRSSVADYTVVASGRVNRHVVAIAEQVAADLSAAGWRPLGIEGLGKGDWVLVDVGSVIIHIFRPEVRLFYNLEKMWEVESPVSQEMCRVE